MASERFYPKVESLGKNCRWWGLGPTAVGCCFPKLQMQNRMSCEGVVDDVCLYLKDGRPPASLTSEQIMEIKIRIPDFDDKSYIPPGDTVA